MSIAAELSRLNGNLASVVSAKAAIAAAIKEKGGVVASGDGLMDLAAGVNTIPAGVPTDVSTSAGMAAVLTAANAGKVYRYTGTTDGTYTSGDLYVVEVS